MKNPDKVFYAHSKEGEPPEKWQLLEDHLRNVAETAKGFAGKFGAGEWAYLAGLWHDLGKYAPDFQQMLRIENRIDMSSNRKTAPINHSSTGAILATEIFQAAGRILAYPIAGHHAGLPDWECDETGNAALSHRIKEVGLLESIKSIIPQEIHDQTFPKDRPRHGADPALWIRMIFSCLVDSDFLDTEAFMSSEKTLLRGKFPALTELSPRFETFMQEKTAQSADIPINHIRSEILKRCKDAAKNTTGIYSLTVPTGGGKTLSSMAFALQHATNHGKERIIYVIPYTSIIEQTADQFRKIFGESIIEHHSNLDAAEETEEVTSMRLACENWDASIIVTTSVQFFESLFASRPSRCRKLHNIVNSVVVLDEVQLLAPEFLKPILFCLRELNKSYGTTLLITTATLPAFSPQPSFGFEGLPQINEIIPDPYELHHKLKRVTVKTIGSLSESVSWEAVAEKLCQHSSVLCIVNRRDDCRMLWQLMPQGTYHLSALMCGAHRSAKIAEIKKRLKDGLPTRVISTQLVEAGVDVDFPAVYRALCGIDSVAQAAGRCNREGLLDQGHVFVFRPPSEPPIGHLRQAAGIGKRLLETVGEDPIAPERFTRFFEELYWLQGERLDAKEIMRDLAPDHEFRFSFRSAASRFRLIDDRLQESVIVTYQDGERLIRELEKRKPDRFLLRKLQRYIVNLPRYLHERLQREGAIRQIHPGIFIQGHSAMYHEDLGFCPDKSILYDPDDLIV